jgi:predicted RecB family nuclease
MRLDGEQLRYSATDLANFLACRHLTRLDVAAANGLVQKPQTSDLGAEALARRGEQHETRVLTELRERGWSLQNADEPRFDFEARAAATEAALHEGIDVVYQGTLLDGERLGLPDFLIRSDLLGIEDGYEIIDAKLARSAKVRAVLQSTFYSRLLKETLGLEPERMHLALGSGEWASFRVKDYAAYERQVDQMFRDFIRLEPAFPPPDTYPEPVEHCAVCRWQQVCVAQRRSDDDLSLVAGITSRLTKALKAHGVATRRGFAALDKLPHLPRVGKKGIAKAHAQARLQVEGEDRDEWLWEFVEPERTKEGELTPDRGLLALPEPASGDLFFDIEGARYYSEDSKEFGLQYLFGIIDSADLDDEGSPRYHAFWAFDRASERRAFEQVMDFMAERLTQHPAAHVYHYNHYEPTALDHLSELHVTREEVLRRLMGRFATREDDLDNLLRRRVFVDLYRVVRQGIRASIESYSIKRLEPFYEFVRQVKLTEVNERSMLFEMALDEDEAANDAEGLRVMEGYNEDDCRSTLALRDWLEDRRTDLNSKLDEDLPRPMPEEVEPVQVDPEIRKLRDALLEELPDEPERTPGERARALMADLLEFHRRDDKPQWWRYFHLSRELTDEELMEEPDAVAGLVFEGIGSQVKKSTLYKYSYPAQEHGFRDGDPAEDPRSGNPWTIHEIDDRTGVLTILRGPSKLDEPHPSALIEPGPQYRKTSHAESLRALSQTVLAVGDGEWPRSAAFDLLLRRRPNADDKDEGPLRRPEEDGVTAGRRLAARLENSCLPVQGPPGTGKTYTGARQILDLVREGRRVGVTANSHSVICNLLDEVHKMASNEHIGVRIGQKPSGVDDRWVSHAAAGADLLFKKNGDVRDALDDRVVDVVGGTTWVWTHPDLEAALDVLVVDEAGQMSLADVLAASRSAKNMILLGDPMQLAHPSQGAHPPGADVSALEHILGAEETMPDHLGLFIERTRRMHPDISRFISEAFYEDRLFGIDGLERQEVLGEGRFSGAGLRIVDVEHEGNANASPEEASEVVAVIQDMAGRRWRDKDGAEHRMGSADVLVVTPFNAQIREIEEALEKADLTRVSVGTVDKFQGRQAPVIVYSMASSSPEEAPRGMEFLYDLHRLNVAISRALCLAIVIASPSLAGVFCRTPHQMHLANALCRLRELAIEG